MPARRLGDIPLRYSTAVRLDERDRQQLEKLAVDNDLPRNALIRLAVRQFLAQNVNPPAETTSPKAQKRTATPELGR